MQMMFLAMATLANAATPAATVSPTPCTAAEYRQMDFLVGDWLLKWNGGEGANHFTKSTDGCVVEGHLDALAAKHLQGHSVSTYSRAQWRQNWSDNQGSHFDLVGGPQPDGTFVLQNVRVDASTPYRRVIFDNIKPDSLTWHWQGSEDGGKTWTDRWVIDYTRVKS